MEVILFLVFIKCIYLLTNNCDLYKIYLLNIISFIFAFVTVNLSACIVAVLLIYVHPLAINKLFFRKLRESLSKVQIIFIGKVSNKSKVGVFLIQQI